jgi:hypothetical protein
MLCCLLRGDGKMILDKDRAGAPAVEITDEMVEAGLSAINPLDLANICDGWGSKDDLIKRVFLAMFLAMPRS